jgi:hypothetical protein
MLLNAGFQLLLYHIDHALPRHGKVHNYFFAVGRDVCILHYHFFIFSRTRTRAEKEQVIEYAR